MSANSPTAQTDVNPTRMALLSELERDDGADFAYRLVYLTIHRCIVLSVPLECRYWPFAGVSWRMLPPRVLEGRPHMSLALCVLLLAPLGQVESAVDDA